MSEKKCVSLQIEIKWIKSKTMDQKSIVFVDTEVDAAGAKLHDIGALRYDGALFHGGSLHQFSDFVSNSHFVVGHNIVHHDARFLSSALPANAVLVDTLFWSPLLFPQKPYHKLLKDDKLQSDEVNNPVNDSRKAMELFYDEVAAFEALPEEEKLILAGLLGRVKEFVGLFKYAGITDVAIDVVALIRKQYEGRICAHADVESLAGKYPCELAYALALIRAADSRSITPPWVLHQFPMVEQVVRILCHTVCQDGCPYCADKLDVHRGLKRFFGYDEFRTYDGERLQEMAVKSAVAGGSLLAIFPTGGGKSLTFQLPALMEGETVHGLTVVISPLQSLMKDQVDNLAERGITSAVTINGLLDPISRADAVNRVADGSATLLYISPEMLRSRTIEHLLSKRYVVRFVVDEAHCFSAWGQAFRVDYLYIGEFIHKFQHKQGIDRQIPVSCFTATAKQKVISDIRDYFRRTLGLELEIFASAASRQNLRYSVIKVDSEEDKYSHLRSLVATATGPSIVYVSRTRRTVELAHKLSRDGFNALPFNGKMDANEKVANQNAFMNGDVRIIVATSAFGMGVDKKDVELVVHYDISDSLENYVQEAGRAGRDPQMQARCYVLFGDQDLDKHFVLLNQTKLSMSEIQQVWRSVKRLTGSHKHTCCSALEIARQAGWDENVQDVETRVCTAISALEQAGYVERGNNVPHVFATGIRVKNMDEAHQRIDQSPYFDEQGRMDAVRIIKSLISSKNTSSNGDGDAESRVDYLSDMLGIAKEQVISTVEKMRQEGILADSRDISVRMSAEDTLRKSQLVLERYAKLELYLIHNIPREGLQLTMKQLNDQAVQAGVHQSSEKHLRTLMNFLSVKGYLKKMQVSECLELHPQHSQEVLESKFQARLDLSRYLLERIFAMAEARKAQGQENGLLMFSEVEMLRYYQVEHNGGLFGESAKVVLEDVEEALLYLSKIGALRLEGGFLVLYNAMEIHRVKDMRLSYKQDDYRLLNEFYKQKIQQIHIVGEYANLMVKDYDAALGFVQDYFHLDHKQFVAKYFKGDRARQLEKNITPAKYDQLFGKLSARQREIISDKDSQYIVVAAGPGSGKTKVLVHKMASLLMLEEVKHEQLLMLTFSRAAATEFKKRLIGLIGNAAHFVEIKTFHAYCFDLLGRVGNLDDAKDVVRRAAEMINQGEVEPNRISKTVLLIDEAQDMDQHEFALVQALMKVNEDMRVVAVGDDDQNVFQFRGADSRYMQQLVTGHGAKFYEMTDNYRSCSEIVALANAFANTIHGRMKSTPISAVQTVEGVVEVVQHVSERMEMPLVRHLKKTFRQGSSCVLTSTNDEALRITALLRRHGVESRLIQSMDGFRFIDLAEVRYFLKKIEQKISTPVISESLWEEAKNDLQRKYESSDCLPMIITALGDFDQVNRSRYLSDLRDFFFESSVEDFCRQRSNEVVVSTIHKAKGLEFDTVYLYVAEGRQLTDDVRRQLYVGLTRAKSRLFIHCSDSRFSGLGVGAYGFDGNSYPMPNEIAVRLTHKDVFLNFFKGRKYDILALRSGDKLFFQNESLFNESGVEVAKISHKFQGELAQWAAKGYAVTKAYVRYVVAWRQSDWPDSEPDVAVLLAELNLERKES